MRRSLGVRFAILGVVAQHPGGVHGYALKRQCDRILGHFWQLNFAEVYRVLNRLAADRLIEAVDDGPDTSRKVYRVTVRGRESLDAFLLQPPKDLPRPLRQELAVKLLFAGTERLPELVRLINSQRDTCIEQLQMLALQRRRLPRLPVDSFVANLLIDGAEGTVRAEIAWLDDVCRKLTARFRAPAA